MIKKKKNGRSLNDYMRNKDKTLSRILKKKLSVMNKIKILQMKNQVKTDKLTEPKKKINYLQQGSQ